MEFTTEKSIGLALLCIGLIVIAIAIYQGNAVFSGTNVPPSISKMQEIVVASSTMDTAGVRLGPMKFMINKEINAVIDTCLWAMFMMFLVVAGGKIAGIGAQMLRDIKVEVKE
jgi:hypothetical protein